MRPHPTKLWSVAHTINGYKKPEFRPILLEAELAWQELLSSAAHKQLLQSNQTVKRLQNSHIVYLLHATSSLKAMQAAKKISPSGGCLVGSIYCTPLTKTSIGLRTHNLGSFIVEQEIPRALKAKGMHDRKVDTLVIELQLKNNSQPIGVDYLRLGAVNLETFRLLSSSMPTTDFSPIKQQVVAHITKARYFLDICIDSIFEHRHISQAEFFALLTRTIRHLPILGYIYFEVLIEFVALFSDDERSYKLADYDELNSWSSKEFIFQLQPSLLKNFNLGEFRPSLATLLRVTEQLNNSGIIRIRTNELVAYVQQRFCQLVCERLLPTFTSSNGIAPNFEDLADQLPDLTGHCLDREIRQPNLYKDLYFYFDRHKARQIWRHWNEYNAALPYNAILPKGEVGLNPSHPDATCTVYLGQPQYHKGVLYIQKREALDIQISADFLHPQHALMGITTKLYTHQERPW